MIPILRNWIDRYFHNEESVLVLVLLLISFVVIWTMGDILGPVLAAIIIAFLMQGIVQWLKERGVKHIIAVAIAVLFLMSAMTGIMLFLIPVLWQQSTKLLNELPGMLVQGKELLLHLPEQYPSFISGQQIEQIILHSSNELAAFGQHVVSFSISNLPVLFIVLLYLILVPLLVFFFLKDGKSMLRWVGTLLPKERPVMSEIWEEMNQQIANYVRGKFIEILLVAATSCIAFVVLDLKYAVLLGLMVGLSVVIPYVGAVVVTIPVILIGYFQWGFGSELAILAVVYLIIQGVDGNILVPVLFSEAVKLHPVAIILSVLVFGGLWGFWGVFFAIPLATLVKAISNAWPTRLSSILSPVIDDTTSIDGLTSDDGSTIKSSSLSSK
ncbi:MAG: putative permease [Cellvibrionaceae bacterium]|jgi:putative permease